MAYMRLDMKKAFTLMELLVVVAIMGLLGTTAVGGYRAMQRGMEQRAVMENANKFIRAAFQRAQIDRVPVAVFFWNETLQEESDTQPLIAIGKAVAVRRSGRISAKEGSFLVDEFADLSFSRYVDSDEADSGTGETETDSSVLQNQTGFYLYPMNGKSDGTQMKRSIVAQSTALCEQTVYLIDGTDRPKTTKVSAYGYYVQDANGVNWKVGDAYGMEFAEMQLPHGYLFGQQYSQNIENPVQGESVMRFKPGTSVSQSGAVTGGIDGGASTIMIYNLRPNSSGDITAQAVRSTSDPSKAE